MKRSVASLAAAEHWAKKHKSVVEEQETLPDTDYSSSSSQEETAKDLTLQQPDIIEILSSDEEKEPLKETRYKLTSSKNFKSPFELIQTPSLREDGVGEIGVSLEELISHRDLVSTFQFNFSIQVDYFLTHIHPEANPQVTFISGNNILQDYNEPVDPKYIQKYNLKCLLAKLEDRFGSHHTKMMINFFTDGTMEIIIMTANLTMLDFGGLTQMCWRSGRLPKGKSRKDQGIIFQNDLSLYLKCYKISQLSQLANTLNEYDFTSIDVELLASAPGTYNLNKVSNTSEIYGYGKLYQLLQRNKLFTTTGEPHSLLSQVSSIASPFKSSKGVSASVFSHILCPIVFHDPEIEPEFQTLPLTPGLFEKHQQQNNYTPYIIYPSTSDISNSKIGWGGGQACHFKYTTTNPLKQQYVQNIRPYLCNWESKIRGGAPPHVKMLLCGNKHWNMLKWALMCSHNLSKQAWGYPLASKKGEHLFKIASYELGVFIPSRSTRKLVPKVNNNENLNLKGDDIPITVPFDLPPNHYSKNDKPWSSIEPSGDLTDITGQTWPGLLE